ncbi:MAG: epoxyqueuosine reductase [Oscillospiraceae bacterium]|nr:epoxyqueuosine reductase [Oscillospiraceae bacterium]
MTIAEKIQALAGAELISEIGFSEQPDTPFEGLSKAITLVVRLSDAVVDEIDDAPTKTYFHHYRTVNAYIDRVAEKLVLLLTSEGYRAAAVPASQSVEEFAGRFSHKKCAVMAGLGSIGKSALFLSKKYGPRVRLGTVFTDAPLPAGEFVYEDVCGSCRLCTDACGALAIKGVNYAPGMERSEIFDARACSEYMKRQFQAIGRGAVCGVCMRVCPKGK